MAKIKYIEFNGTEHEADVANGLSVMEGAIQNDIPGIDADCGGGMSCATCHVYINDCLLYTSPSPRDRISSRMPSSA